MKLNISSIHLGLIGLLWIAVSGVGCGAGTSAGAIGNTVPQSPSHLYVVNQGDSTVSGFSVNPTSGALTSLGVPAKVGLLPTYAAASPNGRFLYVANTANTDNSVSAFTIDAATGALTPTNPAKFKISNDVLPFGVVVDPASKHLYTANALSISAFSIDPTTGALHELPGSPVAAEFGAGPEDLRITPDGRFLYVTDGIAGTVTTYAFDSNGLPSQSGNPVRVGGFPLGILVDPSGRFAYMTNLDANEVVSFSITPTTGVLVPTARVVLQPGCNPMEAAIDASSKLLFTSCTGVGVNIIERLDLDPTTGAITQVQQDFATGDNTSPRGLVVDPSGQFLFSALNSSNQISTETIGADGTIRASGIPAATGKSPTGIVLVPGR